MWVWLVVSQVICLYTCYVSMKGNEIRHLDVFYACGKFCADRCFTGLDICSYVKSHFFLYKLAERCYLSQNDIT